MMDSSGTGFSLSPSALPGESQADRLKPVLLEARNLRKTFSAPAGVFGTSVSRPGSAAFNGVAAVDGVTLELAASETLAIVGESGSGKTTLARILLRLIEPDSGELIVEGRDFLAARGAELRALRREMQMVFQDPFASLDPRMRVGSIVAEPLEIHEPRLSRAERRARVVEVLSATGLGEDALARYPHEFSGGQRQRVGIARALVLRPRLLVADEPVSALDVSVGAQILDLLRNLQHDLALTYLLISHSLPVVAQLATRISVMQAGRIVETGPAERILRAPEHPYTQSLIAAIPSLP
jgi:ABC-type microcin C transport system duplicated ATPase subunit YejF